MGLSQHLTNNFLGLSEAVPSHIPMYLMQNMTVMEEKENCVKQQLANI